MNTTPQDIISFWFEEHGEKDWWISNPDFDQKIIDRFSDTHQAAAAGECFEWRKTPEGRLAEIIVLDQFSRQIYRGSDQAFTQDPMALALAQEAVSLGIDQKLSAEKRHFLYMPYMHSESLLIHDHSIRLFSALSGADKIEFAIGHQDVIKRFGRYPTRNAALGRTDTPEEAKYLSERTGGAV